jgi:hypothetical protein
MAIGYDLVRRVRTWILFYRDLILNLGLAGCALYKLQRLRMRFFAIRTSYTLCSKHARFRLLCRPKPAMRKCSGRYSSRGSTVFGRCQAAQVYSRLRREHRLFDGIFSDAFPEATLIAVEPDPANCAIPEANLARFTGRYRVVRSAIWSEEAGLAFEGTPYHGGRE